MLRTLLESPHAVFLQSQLTNPDALVPGSFVVVSCAILGALIGSFLNVVIHRLPRGESIAFPNSHCPCCDRPVKFYDNVPVLSYLALGGRCRSCGARISPRYPAVEVLTAIMFAVVAYAAGGESGLRLLFDLVFVTGIIALVFIDAEHMILPNKITYPGLAFAIVARLIAPNLYGFVDPMAFVLMRGGISTSSIVVFSLANALLGALVGGGSLWFVGWLWKRMRGVDAMGLGDVKMMLAVGAYLGLALTPLAIFIGVLSGSIIGVLWMWRSGTRDLSAQIPFGIFLGIGSVVSLLYGTQIVDWYLAQFGA